MDLTFLDPVLRSPGPWASAYVANAAPGPDAADHQSLAARGVRDLLREQGATEADAEAVHQELLTLDPQHAGRAVFATGGTVAQSVPLHATPPLPEAELGTVPHLAPLLELAEDPRLCLVAYVDRVGADFELRYEDHHERAGGTEGLDWPIHRTATGDWSERHFQNAVENTWEQNAAETAAELARTAEETSPDLVLLVGDDRQRRSVREKLPDWLVPRVVESEHGGRAAGSRTRLLDEDIERLLCRQRWGYQEELLDRFQAGLGGAHAMAPAVEGVPALLEAAREHRVETLLLTPGAADLHREVWAGDEPDQLAARRSDTQYLGARRPAPVRADDALLRAVGAAGGEAIVLTEEAHRDTALPSGGMGAILRWSYRGDDAAPEAGPGETAP